MPRSILACTTVLEPLDGTLFRVHDDNLSKAAAGLLSDRSEDRNLLVCIKVLRHDHIPSRSQVGESHIDRDGADHFSGRLEVLLPSTDQAAHLVDVQIQCPRMALDEQLRQS
jgi:hypothetical protein